MWRMQGQVACFPRWNGRPGRPPGIFDQLQDGGFRDPGEPRRRTDANAFCEQMQALSAHFTIKVFHTGHYAMIFTLGVKD
jgi:hypothetical protein